MICMNKRVLLPLALRSLPSGFLTELIWAFVTSSTRTACPVNLVFRNLLFLGVISHHLPVGLYARELSRPDMEFWLKRLVLVPTNSMILPLSNIACNLWAGNKHKGFISMQRKLICLFVRLKHIACRACNNVGINRRVNDWLTDRQNT